MRVLSTLASIAVACGVASFACSGRSEGPVEAAPRTMAAGESVPWADIPAPLASRPQPAIPSLAASLSAPRTARPGDVLHYEVTLRNALATTYRWRGECPIFLAILQTPSPEPLNTAGNHQQLNCGPAREIEPGGTARFEMELFIPPTVPAGEWLLIWSFTAPGVPASAPAKASLVIQR